MGVGLINKGNVRIIDPNVGFDNVNHEDLFSYVKLTASTKGRSITSRNDNEVLVVEQTNSPNVSTTTNYIHNDVQLNTDYTDIGGPINNGGDKGGFGVTNINIDVKSSFVPQITIDFVDVRGDSLFGQGPCSPYASFFHMPYPVFNLTVKGYYGKPVVYTLALRKFNTSFNSDTGNFEIKADFIGYTYAFLTDIIIGYAFTASNMPGGARHLNDLWGEIKSEDYGKNPLPKTPINLMTLVKDLKTYEKVSSELSQKNEQSTKSKNVEYVIEAMTELSNKLDGLTEEVFKIQNEPKKNNGDITYKDNNNQVKEIVKKFFEGENSTYGVYYNKKISEKINQIGIESRVPKKLIKENNGNETTIKITTKYKNEIQKVIDESLKIQKKLRKETLEKVKSELEKKVNYNPTILNLMTILLINVEVFLRMLVESSIKAESIHSNKKNNSVLGGSRNGDENRVFPWPTYVNNNTKVEEYPKKEKDWEEVRFVENFLSAYLTYQKEIEEILDDTTDAGGPGSDFYIPINPIESTENIVNNKISYDGVKDKETLYDIISGRAFICGDFSSSNALSSYVEKNIKVIGDEIMFEYGKRDGYGAYNTILEPKLREFFNGLNSEQLINLIENDKNSKTKKLTYDDWLDTEVLPNGIQRGEVTNKIIDYYTQKSVPNSVMVYEGAINLKNVTVPTNKKINKTSIIIKEEPDRKIELNEGSLILSFKNNTILRKPKSFISKSYGDGVFSSFTNTGDSDEELNYFTLDNDSLIPTKGNTNGGIETNSNLTLDTFNGLDDQTFGNLTKMDLDGDGNNNFITPVGFGKETTEGDATFSDTVRNSTIIQSPLWVYNRQDGIEHRFFGWESDKTSENDVVISKTDIKGIGGNKEESDFKLAYLFLITTGYDEDVVGIGNGSYFHHILNKDYTYQKTETLNPLVSFISGKLLLKKSFILLIGAVLWRQEQDTDPIIWVDEEVNVAVGGSTFNSVDTLNKYKKLNPNEYPLIVGNDGQIKNKTFSFILKGDTEKSYAKISGDGELKPIFDLDEDTKKHFIEYFTDWVLNDWSEGYLNTFDVVQKIQDMDDYNTNEEKRKEYKKTVFNTYNINEETATTDNITLNVDSDAVQSMYDDLMSEVGLTQITPYNFNNVELNKVKERFNISDTQHRKFIQGWLDAFKRSHKEEQKKEKEDSEKDDKKLDSNVKDDDLKLSLYRSFKALFDKWITRSSVDGSDFKMFYNNTSNNNTNKGGLNNRRSLLEHFSFVNRGFNDVGNKAMIDVSSITSIFKDPTKSLYQVITNLLKKGNFDFFPLPNFIPYGSLDDSDLKNMFEPIDNLQNIDAGPSFVCMFNGGNSKSLNLGKSIVGSTCEGNTINYDYSDDGFTFTDSTSLSESPLGDTDSKATAFLVSFGDGNQSHFKSLSLDQAEFKETQESLKVISRLGNDNNTNKTGRVGKGQSLYDVYQTRSYTCKVEALGNLQIQPMTYFELVNVPMFRGAYLITEVSHSVTPNNVSTSFTGVRVPRVNIPIVEDPFSYMFPDENEYNSNNNTSISVNSYTGPYKGSLNIVKTIEENMGLNGNIENGTITREPIGNISGVKKTYTNKDTDKILSNAVIPLREMLTDWVEWLKGNGFQPFEGNYYVQINDAYRTIGRQEALKVEYGNSAATPGTSNHGWGIAIDLQYFRKDGTVIKNRDGGVNIREGFNFKINESIVWLLDNSYKYGWVIPYKLRDQAGTLDEFWHWEYHGTSAVDHMNKFPRTYKYTTNVNEPLKPFVTNPKKPNGKSEVYSAKNPGDDKTQTPDGTDVD